MRRNCRTAKSGVALRFPRIARIRIDKPAAEADRVESLMALVEKKLRTTSPIDRFGRVLRSSARTGGGDLRRWLRTSPSARCRQAR